MKNPTISEIKTWEPQAIVDSLEQADNLDPVVLEMQDNGGKMMLMHVCLVLDEPMGNLHIQTMAGDDYHVIDVWPPLPWANKETE